MTEIYLHRNAVDFRKSILAIFLCGEEFFQYNIPIHPTFLTKWRNQLGKSGSEALLIETIKAND